MRLGSVILGCCFASICFATVNDEKPSMYDIYQKNYPNFLRARHGFDKSHENALCWLRLTKWDQQPYEDLNLFEVFWNEGQHPYGETGCVKSVMEKNWSIDWEKSELTVSTDTVYGAGAITLRFDPNSYEFLSYRWMRTGYTPQVDTDCILSK